MEENVQTGILQRASRTPVLAFVTCLLAALACPLVASDEVPRILIESVSLIDREQDAEDVVVSILIVDGKLDTVTRDSIEALATDRVVKAQGRFLLGTLALAEPASFVILSADPRENIQLLMDSRRYVRFAMENGVVIRDELTQTGAPQSARDTAPPAKKSGWLAYTPPPLALPLSYSNKKKVE